MISTSHKVTRIVQVSSGNFFEAFDLIVFGSFVKIIAGNFFPQSGAHLSLMFAFSTFASAYIMRFVGAVVLGPYFDHAGRRKGLLVSFTLMASGTGVVAFVPVYSTIGLLAPVLLIAGRLLQGFSVGSETGGIAAYLVEIAPSARKAFYVSWNATTFHLATLLAVLLAFGLSDYLTPSQMMVWGWRIPFAIGCGLIPVIFFMRKSLVESDEFLRQERHPAIREVIATVAQNWRIFLTGMFMVVLGSCIFYFIFTFMPVFVKESLGLTTSESLLATVIAITFSIFLVPVFAILSDSVGRFPVISATAVVVIFTAYPALHYLIAHPNFHVLIAVQLWFAVLYSAYASSSFVWLSEKVPARVRATGYGVSTTLGLALFGGCTPLISAWLIHATGNDAAPSLWLVAVAVCSLAAACVLSKVHFFESATAMPPGNTSLGGKMISAISAAAGSRFRSKASSYQAKF